MPCATAELTSLPCELASARAVAVSTNMSCTVGSKDAEVLLLCGNGKRLVMAEVATTACLTQVQD